MGLNFANPLALWALLGIPTVILIHFLQVRSRRAEANTLFLLEFLAEETRKGAMFQRIRNGMQLWMQLLAVLLITLILSRPMWVRKDSRQPVGIVVDASFSMSAFSEGLEQELDRLWPRLKTLASGRDWWIRSSALEDPLIYRGDSDAEARQALLDFRPQHAAQDPRDALLQMREQMGPESLILYLSDHDGAPPPARAQRISIGRPLENAGFSGIRFEQEGDQWVALLSLLWRGEGAAQRGLRLLNASGEELLQLQAQWSAPGLEQLKIALPPDLELGLFELEGDALAADNQLPFVVPRLKTLEYRIHLEGPEKEFAEKLMASLPETEASLDAALSLGPGGAQQILFASSDGEEAEFAAVLAEAHPFTEELPWQGFLARPLQGRQALGSEDVLLWMGERPLLLLDDRLGAEVLSTNFIWEQSNAERWPSMILLLHRFLEDLRKQAPGLEQLNLECRQVVNPPNRVEGELQLWQRSPGEAEWQSSLLPPGLLRSGALPGWLELRDDSGARLRVASAFLDLREGDLREAASRSLSQELLRDEQERFSEQDVLRPLWFLLLALCLGLAWWSGGARA